MKQISVQAVNLTSVYNKGKIGLHPCSFEIEKNSMVAILGPTGCGKSTLLKTLIGVIPSAGGKVFIAGLELKENYELLKTHIGYVPQHDHDAIHFDLTVLQCLTYSARIRLPELSTKEQNLKVERILKKLNIYHEKEKLVKELSGGQQKRVSIAVEILIDPIVLLLDEPTSPLDPQTISDFLLMLKDLTKQGTTVIMVTHKPEDLYYMDECIFMGVGGYLTYKGNVDGILGYFNQTTIHEIYKLVNSDSAGLLAKKYYEQHVLSSSVGDWDEIRFSRTRNVNYLSQYFYLSLRYLSRKLNDYKSLLVTIGQAPIIAVLMIFIFPEINHIVLFFISISAIWFGTNNSAKEIVSERQIFHRERMYNQGIIPFILSKITVLSIVGFIQSIIFISILHFNYKNNFIHISNDIEMIIWMSFTIIVSSLFGLMLSSFSKSSEKVMGYIPIALIPQIMISGIIVKISGKILISYISFLTIARWSTTGLSRLQTEVERTFFNPNGLSIVPLRENLGDTFESTLNFKSNEPTFELYILFIHAIIYFILIYLNLRDKDLYRN
jgi:ABC-type multidrug transport system ATPase subunit